MTEINPTNAPDRLDGGFQGRALERGNSEVVAGTQTVDLGPNGAVCRSIGECLRVA